VFSRMALTVMNTFKGWSGFRNSYCSGFATRRIIPPAPRKTMGKKTALEPFRRRQIPVSPPTPLNPLSRNLNEKSPWLNNSVGAKGTKPWDAEDPGIRTGK